MTSAIDRNQYARDYYQQHKEKILEQRAKLRDANHKDLTVKHHEYYEATREKRLQYQKDRYYAKKGVKEFIEKLSKQKTIIKVKKPKQIRAEYFKGTLEDKLKIFTLLGFYYENGNVYSQKGVKNNTAILRLCNSKYNMTVSKNHFAWYYIHKTICPGQIQHKDGNRKNCHIDNMFIREVYDNGFKSGENHISKTMLSKRSPGTNYINNTNLIFNIIIDQAKGFISKTTTDMLMSIAYNLSKKFYYKYEEHREDCISEGIFQMISNYHNFNYVRHENAFSYFTELCKRAMAKQMNEINNIKYYQGKNGKYTKNIMQTISINNLYL